jgi:alpha-D-xyloside xylohydrolase
LKPTDIDLEIEPLFEFRSYALYVRPDPFLCLLRQEEDGRRVWQVEDLRYRGSNGPWRSLDSAEWLSIDDRACSLRLLAEDGTPLALELAVDADLLRASLAAEGPNASWVSVDLRAGPNEHYLGLGERFDKLDQRGNQVDLWVVNGAQGRLTYKPIPFYQSSAGYGLFLDTDVRCIVRIATPDDPDVVSIRNAAPALEMTVIPGRSPKEILSRYAAIAGRPETPPKWVFGPWKSRNWKTENQTTVYEDVERQRELSLPATVKLIDARWESAYHTFTFDRERYPRPKRMIEDIHALGYRLVLWVSPWIVYDEEPGSPFEFCADQDYLIRHPDGGVYVHRLGNSPTLIGSCIDFTNPAAVSWWQENVRRLVNMGVDGFKTDFGEQVPEDAVFYDGRTGREMHNVFPRLYNQITYEAMDGVRPGVLLARSAWHGSQGLSAVWAGDQTSDFAPASGLPSVIIAGQSAGLSGFPYWTSDIGGYFGVPTDETFARWSQFGAFSPIMQIHGADVREPWSFSAETLGIYRQFASEHIDLFPYIYTYARHAAQTGVPLMRALALEFPDDPGVWGDLSEHQYCFGAELLVAPVYSGFTQYRTVYLPRGAWRDFWTGERLEGGTTVNRPVSLDHIPVFARLGALVPRLDPTPDTLLPAAEEAVREAGPDLRLDVYPGADGGFTLYDGTTFRWRESDHVLAIEGAPLQRQISVRLVGEPLRFAGVVRAGGAPVPSQQGSLGGESDYVRCSLEPDQEIEASWTD